MKTTDISLSTVSSLSLAEFLILSSIERNEECTQKELIKELKEKCGLSRQLAHYKINKLYTKNHFIVQKYYYYTNDDNKRDFHTYYAFTPTGRQVYNSYLSIINNL